MKSGSPDSWDIVYIKGNKEETTEARVVAERTAVGRYQVISTCT